MIVDLERFLAEEGPCWKELESMLDRLERDPERKLELSELTRFHELYQRCSADLAKLATFSGERDMRLYLEGMVARAYCEIH